MTGHGNVNGRLVFVFSQVSAEWCLEGTVVLVPADVHMNFGTCHDPYLTCSLPTCMHILNLVGVMNHECTILDIVWMSI